MTRAIQASKQRSFPKILTLLSSANGVTDFSASWSSDNDVDYSVEENLSQADTAAAPTTHHPQPGKLASTKTSSWEEALGQKISELLTSELKQSRFRPPPPSSHQQTNSSEKLIRIEPGDMTVFRLRTGQNEDAHLRLHNYGSSAALGVEFLPSRNPSPSTPLILKPILISQPAFLLQPLAWIIS